MVSTDSSLNMVESNKNSKKTNELMKLMEGLLRIASVKVTEEDVEYDLVQLEEESDWNEKEKIRCAIKHAAKPIGMRYKDLGLEQDQEKLTFKKFKELAVGRFRKQKLTLTEYRRMSSAAALKTQNQIYSSQNPLGKI